MTNVGDVWENSLIKWLFNKSLSQKLIDKIESEDYLNKPKKTYEKVISHFHRPNQSTKHLHECLMLMSREAQVIYVKTLLNSPQVYDWT